MKKGEVRLRLRRRFLWCRGEGSGILEMDLFDGSIMGK